MGLKSLLAPMLARWVDKKTQQWVKNPVATQDLWFARLMKGLSETQLGKDHGITPQTTYNEFKAKVPVKDYEGWKPYFDEIVAGKPSVTWPGKPAYLAKTSGTTSGAKYIPITKDSIGNHINSARNALLKYVLNSGNSKFLDGKLIFLSGSPVLEEVNGIPTGRLSGLVNHHVPQYLRTNQMPAWDTNCMEDWEEKVGQIARETQREDMTLISGIPPWVQMYFDILRENNEGIKIKELFPNFSLMVYGGVNFEPYRKKIEDTIGGKVDTLETYPASEGFIAYQDNLEHDGLLLLLNEGIFYEFIPLDELHNEQPKRLSIGEVEVGVNYAIVINSNAGLWGYLLGDTVQFVSTHPFKLKVSGRIKHFISAFGEHVIGEEVEYALTRAAKELNLGLIEYTVAPQVNPEKGLPHHEWFVEFADDPQGKLEELEDLTDSYLRKKNSYYDDLISGNVLRPLHIRPLQKGAFQQYMKSQGKLGGQNKVPRLSNDRKIADKLKGLSII